MITLYSTGCPKCKVLEKKLRSLNIDFNLIDDADEVLKFGREHHIMSAPILVVDDQIMMFNVALDYLKEQSSETSCGECGIK